MKTHKIEAFENLVEAFNALPSIGKKSAVKLAYHVVMEDGFMGMKLAHALEDAINSIARCSKCNNMSEDELCPICSDAYRDTTKLCIVQSAKDILTIEESGRFDGIYYVITSIHDIDEAYKQPLCYSAKLSPLSSRMNIYSNSQNSFYFLQATLDTVTHSQEI
jgi:recombination protein RecR